VIVSQLKLRSEKFDDDDNNNNNNNNNNNKALGIMEDTCNLFLGPS
jgi:hypothetical protein